MPSANHDSDALEIPAAGVVGSTLYIRWGRCGWAWPKASGSLKRMGVVAFRWAPGDQLKVAEHVAMLRRRVFVRFRAYRIALTGGRVALEQAEQDLAAVRAERDAARLEADKWKPARSASGQFASRQG